VQLIAVALFCGAIATVALFMRRYVDTKVAVQNEPPQVVVKDRPAWMVDTLAEQIVRSVQPDAAHSTFDHQLLVSTAEKLRTNPWIQNLKSVRRVHGKKPGDTLEIDADFRAPIALVKWGEYYSYVDNDGVKLPEQFTAADVKKVIYTDRGQVNIRMVEGAFNPPPDPGKPWRGEDIAAALAMIKLLAEQPWAQDVVAINVENFDRRKSPKEAQLVLKTRYNTEIRWGRPLNAKDFFVEVSTDQKLASLTQIYQQFGRIDAKQPWLDIRFDKITYPAPSPQAQVN
jgi:hypothetical protein